MKPAFGNREKTTLMRLQFSIGLTSNPRTWPVIDGQVTPDAIDLVPTVLHPSELFWRQLRFAEFDVAEMSVSSLMMAKSKGDDRFVGIPVFTTRRFFHTGILVRRAAGIETPADLKGKRVGVPEYQQTAALWARGVLQHEFGVAPKDMEFWMERPPSHSHGGATGFVPPPGVTVNRIPLDKNIGSMMLAASSTPCCSIWWIPISSTAAPQTSRVIPTSRPCFPIRWPKASATIARPASTPSTMAW